MNFLRNIGERIGNGKNLAWVWQNSQSNSFVIYFRMRNKISCYEF